MPLIAHDFKPEYAHELRMTLKEALSPNADIDRAVSETRAKVRENFDGERFYCFVPASVSYNKKASWFSFEAEALVTEYVENDIDKIDALHYDFD